MATLPWWYVYAPPGAHETGPGAGASGKQVISPIESVFAGGISGLWDSVVAAAEQLNSYVKSRGDKEAEVKEAIGERAAGIAIGELKLDVDELTLARRRQMLADLKASKDADAYRYFILYAEALQTHEAKRTLYVERLNALMKANNAALNWQERVRLAADVGLLGGQNAVAQQEMIEIQNRAMVQAALDQLELLTSERQRNDDSRSTEAMLSGPAGY